MALTASTVLSISGLKDTQYTKIFVGGLPYHTTDQSLREYFEHFGDIEEAVVITDRQTGKSRGYGFVTMNDRMSAERACKDPNPIIDGRKANVNLAYLGAKPRQNGLTGVLPYMIKSMPGITASQFGYPTQYVFPSSYLTTATSATSSGLLATLPTTSPLPSSPAGTQPQYAFDYAAAYSAATAAQFAGFDAYSPYATTSPTASYGLGIPAGYTYAFQHPYAASSTPFPQFQPQPIQERL